MFFVYFDVVPLVCGLNAVLRCWFQCVIIRYTRVDDESANQAWLRLALRFVCALELLSLWSAGVHIYVTDNFRST